MKTKQSAPRPRDHTPGEIRFCNYYLHFPDGDVWSDYTHIAGGFEAWIKNTMIWRKMPDQARLLSKKGECHWKDQNGVTHRMQISDFACERKWGLNQKLRRGVGPIQG